MQHWGCGRWGSTTSPAGTQMARPERPARTGSLRRTGWGPVGHSLVCNGRHRRPSRYCKEASLCRTVRRIPSIPCQGVLAPRRRCTCAPRDTATAGSWDHTRVHRLRLPHRTERNAGPRGTPASRTWAGTRVQERYPRRKNPRGTPTPVHPGGMADRTACRYGRRTPTRPRRHALCLSRLLGSFPLPAARQ